MKTVFMFPGQGTQYIGMAEDFYRNFECSRKCFEIAGSACGLDMEALIFKENDNINITEYTQIAILTAEIAMLAAVRQTGIKQDYNTGLSLGEYSALVASGALDFANACRLVRKRGIIMAKEVPAGVGALSAVLGLELSVVEEVIAQTIADSRQDISQLIGIANYNCPGQYVITGRADLVKAVGDRLRMAGAKKVIPLKVSGPFHSPMLKGAGDKLGAVLDNIEFSDVAVPYVTNYDAGIVTSKEDDIKGLLQKQVYSPVRFEQSVRKLINMGCDTFVDIGPGHSLGNFVRRINSEVRVINIEKITDLEALYGI
ncbi:MAG: ACP S-malonyltransferase [Lachnospiraceae bacterium]